MSQTVGPVQTDDLSTAFSIVVEDLMKRPLECSGAAELGQTSHRPPRRISLGDRGGRLHEPRVARPHGETAIEPVREHAGIEEHLGRRAPRQAGSTWATVIPP
jgi:hypothetical protein